MDLPTYTSIWRIEKRLYKLYDFRLPMPVPVGQILVFAGITLPYVLLLTLLGLPFSHNLFWLYVLPPGVLTWLATRPVLESKRLPELILSQIRYLGEPRAWCRMAPAAESDEVVVTVRVWRRGQAVPDALAARARPEEAGIAVPPAVAAEPGVAVAAAPGEVAATQDAAPARHVQGSGQRAGAPAQPGAAARPGAPGQDAAPAGAPVHAGAPAPGGSRARAGAQQPAATGQPATQQQQPATQQQAPRPHPIPASRPVPAPAGAVGEVPAQRRAGTPAGTTVPAAPGRAPGHGSGPSPSLMPSPQPAVEGPAVRPPVVVVPAAQAPARRPPAVERVLGGPPGRRSGNWRDHVVVVPGGRGPGRPDHDKRDRARAELSLDGSRMVVVLGCTVGAGQTVTTLMLAELLASLRGEPVAALDLNPGPACLTELSGSRAVALSGLLDPRVPGSQAGHVPRGPHERGRPDIICHDSMPDGARTFGDGDHRRLARVLSSRYQITLTDPGAPVVARMLGVADQLVLVAPSSPDAGRALAMTWEWLGDHGHRELSANSIVVLNGLSKRSLPHAEQAENVVRGRCRAIVRVPWDDLLAAPEGERIIRDSLAPAGVARLARLRPPVLEAYTALAGVLVTAMVGAQPRRAAR